MRARLLRLGVYRKPKWHNAVGGIMADIGRPKKRNGMAGAPVPGDLLCLLPEWPVIFQRIHPAQPQPGDSLKMRGDMEKQPVHRIEIFGHLLDHHHMAGKVGHLRGAAQHRQRHQIEGNRGLRTQRRLQPCHVAGQPAERAAHRLLPSRTAQIGNHWPMRWLAYAMPVQPGQQIAHVGIA